MKTIDNDILFMVSGTGSNGEIMVEGIVLITPVPIMVLAHLMEALGTEGIIVWDMPLDPRLGICRRLDWR
ncbi:hypothetical protein CHD54_15140 [Salmonella enterica]|nr:hypothetical protein CHD54_15140 [Salmonella enterica]